MQIPLPKGIVGDEDIPKLQERLVNLFNPGDNTLLTTPGRDAFATGAGSCRGDARFKDEYYQISGSSLIRVNENGSIDNLGLIGGSADCVTSVNFVALVIIVKGGNGYVYQNNALIQITDSDFVPCIDVETINQRFVFTPADGGPLFYTDATNPDNIPALNFFDAELLPDRNTGSINLRNDLYVGGEESFELFRDQGDADTPFLRVDGGAIETGYLSAKARYKDTFLFLGRDRGGSYAFHAMSSGDAPKISNPAIDELLNDEYTPEELFDCTSQRFTWKGVDMVGFRLARHSLLYYGSGWSYIQTGIDSPDTVQPWSVNYLTYVYGGYLCGSAVDNSIAKLSNSNLDVDTRIERVIETYIKTSRDEYFPINTIELDSLVGTALIEGTMGLQISKDGKDFGPVKYRPLGAMGKSQQRVVWYGGAGVFESYCGVRLRTTADVTFSCDGLTFNGQ